MTRPDPSFWRGKRVLLTGHTGFKGSWAACWLQHLGAEVTGLALAPETTPDLHTVLGLTYAGETIADIRDADRTRDAIAAANPQIVLHMAAQPLVRRSYRDPLETIGTNVMGTAHVLDALRTVADLEAALVVTSDKAYDNAAYGTPDSPARPFVEGDPVGGRDPYSASKGAQELITRSYAQSFFDKQNVPVASARAGNVIGGGDWSEDRLMADIVRAMAAGEAVHIRNPNATRPWQHVLEPVAGYLSYAQALATGETKDRALNFGPAGSHPVKTVVTLATDLWPDAPDWISDAMDGPAEAATLELDSSRAAASIGWQPQLKLEDAVRMTVEWHIAHMKGHNMREVTQTQIEAYEALLPTR